jgi:hypothetical protein
MTSSVTGEMTESRLLVAGFTHWPPIKKEWGCLTEYADGDFTAFMGGSGVALSEGSA